MKKIVYIFNGLLHKPLANQLVFLVILSFSLILHLICMTQACLLVEEAYYWNYSQHLDWSYLDHPPMVALLIKVFTSLFGSHEFSVRAASLFCWFISSFFAYRLGELIERHSGRYAIFILATIPFFFFQSIVITPDVPLIASWSACLYFLYRALILEEAQAWYSAGISLGLGLLSKYTMGLVALSAFIYVLCHAKSRFWLKRKEPYLGLLLAFLLFSPVLYWNAQHEWVSFIFQSTRRFNSTTSINIHHLGWIVLFFITPMGVWGLIDLAKKTPSSINIGEDKKGFLQYFTFIPLLFFAVYSLNHGVNFNWPGPLFLALLPWLSLLIVHNPLKKTLWFIGCSSLLLLYSGVLLTISFNKNNFIQQKVLIKVIAWDNLIQQLTTIAADEEQKSHKPVVFVPLDNYPINSELAFYQQLLFKKGLITKYYPSLGAHIFNKESLMYRYWSNNQPLADAQLILVAKEAWRFGDPEVTKHLRTKSKIKYVWSQGQGQHLRNIPYYYQIAQMKE